MKTPIGDRRVLGLGIVVLSAAFLTGWATRGQAVEPLHQDAGPLMVTSTLGATSAVLFVLDPEARTLAAYEAVPGTEGGLSLLGARKITHDLHLSGYRDSSEFSFAELRDRYREGSGSTPRRDDG